jgi:hypothetical protein
MLTYDVACIVYQALPDLRDGDAEVRGDLGRRRLRGGDQAGARGGGAGSEATRAVPHRAHPAGGTHRVLGPAR